MIKSKLYDNNPRFYNHVMYSIADKLGKDEMHLVIEYNEELIELDKNSIMVRSHKASTRYMFNPASKKMFVNSKLMIIFMKSLHVSNEDEFKLFNDYIDSLGLDEGSA